MSLPCTTMLSLDFFKSRVSISVRAMSGCSLSRQVLLTVAPGVEVDDAPYTHIDDAQEALVLFLELLLVKDLHCQYAVLGDPPIRMLALRPP